jgi:hypothetical protein
MDLSRHVDVLREALTTAVAAGGQQAQETARLLSDAMSPAVRLVLMEALSEMAAEVTTALDGTTVDVRLRGGEPEIVVTEAPHGPEPVRELPAPGVDEDDTAVVRISLRLPDALKGRAEQAAAVAGTSLNSWLGRAVADALRADRSSSRRGPRSYSGFARS